MVAATQALEREQFRAFIHTHCAHNGGPLFLKLVAGASLCGALLHLAYPGAIGWGPALVGANVAGILLGLGMVFSLFYYRILMRYKVALLGAIFSLALAGMLIGSTARLLGGGKPLATLVNEFPQGLAVALGVTLLVTIPMLVVGTLRARHAEALAESQLRMLRAQVEPHFLFNTLGAVQQLAQDGAPRAAELTADLIDFLRASLSDMRCDSAPLAAEFGLVESYLKVMRTRLGERLRFALALPPDLAGVRVPGMLLLTLVENAVKHGIEPSLRGGDIDVTAARDGAQLLLRVRDTGVGLRSDHADDRGSGGGTGLANVRQRLWLAYCTQGTLVLRDADPGAVAEIRLPLPADAGSTA